MVDQCESTWLRRMRASFWLAFSFPLLQSRATGLGARTVLKASARPALYSCIMSAFLCYPSIYLMELANQATSPVLDTKEDDRLGARGNVDVQGPIRVISIIHLINWSNT